MAVVATIQPKNPVPLALAADGSYVSDNEEIKTTFTQSDSNAVDFESKGYKIRIYPGSLKYLDLTNGLEDVLYDANSATSVEISRDFHALYRHFPDAEERFEVVAGKIKHYVTLNSEQRTPVDFLSNPLLAVSNVIEFDPSLRIRQRGMVMIGDFQTDADLELIDPNGNLIFTIPAIEAWDQKQETTSGLFVVSCLNPGQIEIAMTVDSAWISDPARVYPIVIDPTVIANSSYVLYGSENATNQRTAVELSNGWLVLSLCYSGTAYMYVSKDGGTTWAQLCTIAGAAAPPGLASVGTNVYASYTLQAANSLLYLVSFDATTVSNTDLSSTKKTAATFTGSSYINPTASISVKGNGTIGIAVGGVSLNSYVFNVYYVESSDGGNTWTTPQKVSNTEPAGGRATGPCLVYDKNNSPVIAFTWNNNSGNSDQWQTVAYLNSGTWATVPLNPPYPAQVGSNQLAVGPDGKIYNVFSAGDVGKGYFGIAFSQSPDNGRTWSALIWLVPNTSSTTQTFINPTIAIDPARGDLYVFFQFYYAGSQQYSQIRMLKYTASTGTWGSVTNITSNTQGANTCPNTVGGTYANMNATDAIRYFYQDSVNGIIAGSFSIDQAPNAPILTTKPPFDSTTQQTFAWTFSDPNPGDTQSAFQLQIFDVATNMNIWDTVKQASTSGQYTLPAGTLTNGKQYQWRVCTWDSSGIQGPFSEYATFYTAAPPVVTITNPTADGAVVGVASLTTQWSYSDLFNNAQQSYNVQLTDSADKVLWDSLIQTSSSNAQTIGYTLSTNTTYKVKITATNSKGITSTVATRTFTTNFVPPAIPILAAISGNGYISLSITNPVPTGSQPMVLYNDVYRRETGTTDWTRIATNIPTNGSYNDYAAASGKAYEYKATAIGSDTACTDSAIASTTLYLSGIWIHDVTDPEGTVHQFKLFDTGNRKSDLKPDGAMVQFAGRTRPRAMFGTSAKNNVQMNLQMLSGSGDWQVLQSLINSRNTLCYRDAVGRKIFGVILELPVTDFFYGNAASIQVDENSYVEGV